MSDQLLNILKYFLVALVWLFFVRVLSAVWSEVRKGGAVPSTDRDPPASGSRAATDWTRSGGDAGRAARPPLPAPVPRRPVAAPTVARAGAVRTAGPATVARLKVIEPPGLEGRTFELGDEVTVGRADGCGVQLGDDSFISQRHARVFRRDGEVWVEDLGSTNGTYLNTRKLTAPAPLHEGDRLKVGNTVLEASQ